MYADPVACKDNLLCSGELQAPVNQPRTVSSFEMNSRFMLKERIFHTRTNT